MQREFISALAEKINKKSNFTVWFNGNLHLNEKKLCTCNEHRQEIDKLVCKPTPMTVN